MRIREEMEQAAYLTLGQCSGRMHIAVFVFVLHLLKEYVKNAFFFLQVFLLMFVSDIYSLV
jgi:hypothetical protein